MQCQPSTDYIARILIRFFLISELPLLSDLFFQKFISYSIPSMAMEWGKSVSKDSLEPIHRIFVHFIYSWPYLELASKPIRKCSDIKRTVTGDFCLYVVLLVNCFYRHMENKFKKIYFRMAVGYPHCTFCISEIRN